MLTHRENMLRVIRRDHPEFVPLEMPMSGRLLDVFKQRIKTDKGVEDYFGTSSRWLGPKRIAPPRDFSRYFADITLPEGTSINPDWGEAQVYNKETDDMLHISPLRDRDTLKDLEEFPFPKPDDYDFKDCAVQVRKKQEEGYCVYGGGITVFETCWNVRGFDNLMADMLVNREFAHALFDIVTEFNKAYVVRMVRTGIDVLSSGGDVATQRGLLMSPDLWREYIKPMMKTVYSAAREANPRLLVLYHSCGRVEDVVPELIEVGVDALNPIQPECNDIFMLKKKYGDRLSFFGGIGVQSVLPFGSTEEVRRMVRETIRVMGHGGGYICAPSHTMRHEIPWDNIMAYVDAVRTYGRYPLE